MKHQREVRTVSWGAGQVDSGPPMGTNAWARWSAICGVFALVPLGFAFGVVGLRQSMRRDQPGKGLALVGLASSLVWASLLSTAFTMPGASVDRNADGSVSAAQVVSIFSVQPGDCFNWPPDSGDNVQMVTVTPCTGTHDAHVFAITERPYLDGTVTIKDASGKACAATAAAKALPSGSHWGFIYPDRPSAAPDGRTVICYTTP